MSFTIAHAASLGHQRAFRRNALSGALPRMLGMLVLTGVLAFSSTSRAQIVDPEDGDYVGYMYNSFTVSGYTFSPGATIKIQARNFRGGGWNTIATTTATSSGHFGFYTWSATTSVPPGCWVYFGYNSIYEAELRAVEVTGYFSYNELGDPITIYGSSGSGS